MAPFSSVFSSIDASVSAFSLVATEAASFMFEAHSTDEYYTKLISPLLPTPAGLHVLGEWSSVHRSIGTNEFTFSLHMIVSPFTFVPVPTRPQSYAVPIA